MNILSNKRMGNVMCLLAGDFDTGFLCMAGTVEGSELFQNC